MTTFAREYLGSGIGFPFRASAQGLPDLRFAQGEALVDDVLRFVMMTAPGDLQWDPAVGVDPVLLRLDPTDERTARANARLMEDIFLTADPRIAEARVDIKVTPRKELAEPSVTYRVIDSPTPESDVRLPLRSQEDRLREVPLTRIPIQGLADAVSIGIPGLGNVGNE